MVDSMASHLSELTSESNADQNSCSVDRTSQTWCNQLTDSLTDVYAMHDPVIEVHISTHHSSEQGDDCIGNQG